MKKKKKRNREEQKRKKGEAGAGARRAGTPEGIDREQAGARRRGERHLRGIVMQRCLDATLPARACNHHNKLARKEERREARLRRGATESAGRKKMTGLRDA